MLKVRIYLAMSDIIRTFAVESLINKNKSFNNEKNCFFGFINHHTMRKL